MDPEHTPEKPTLRRVNSPIEESESYFDVMSKSKMTDCISDLIGPNVKFHHSKINAKLPGGTTAVKWHQDFPFTPHSNDDLITAPESYLSVFILRKMRCLIQRVPCQPNMKGSSLVERKQARYVLFPMN